MGPNWSPHPVHPPRLRAVHAARVGQRDAKAMRSVPRGRLCITAPTSFGSEWLAPALADYLQLHPEVSVDLSLNDRMVDLVEEGYDAAIRIAPLGDSSMIARPLLPYGMAICAAPAYLQQRGTPLTPADLARHECLDFRVGAVGIHWRMQAMRDGAAGADYLPAPRPMHLAYPRDRRATPKLTTFIDFIVERFGPAAHLPLASSA